ncbi:uncharacterized protein [Nicotiana tomentosiformis]|uniref:uncharacterized protein n=1 Tax=Nicotiana tomentosiformis TaxID=4098 RepID=UPI00388C468A
MTRFFWGSSDEKNRHHWSSWAKMFYPIEEGGLGFTRLKDISDALAMKRWWRFRTGLSHGWQSILAVKDKVEEQIMRKVNSGSSSLIWDNWTSFGAIALVINHNGTNRHQIVKDLIDNGHWNIDHLHLPEYLAEIILSIPIGNPHCPDTPICMPTTNENFSTSSAWDITRQHKEPDHFIYNIWHKSTPFNMFLLVLKMLKNKLPFYNIISRIGIEVDTKCCCCCADAKDETIHHTFLDGILARIIWNVFGIPLGIPWEPGSIRTQMIKWWTVKPKNGLHKDLLKIIPIFILWEIWKARCANRYGKKKGKSNTAWQLQNSIDVITQMLSQTTNIVQHCYREANQIANALAKWSIEEHER